ncbi:iron-containing alcohol dehydrogenase [Thermanaerothrix sp. 4228-RoL]|uniref:Iron-containing alcohol dehydrogenase n=1 Tax=Thermanaerothrix solaris TaxID=3058434 RepID=A0ABU3NJ71_9CHLR|nr:iron-containing alcohol dehydrogenase [Thermanaerothrix sp. 4228-RoL]MDT8896909.1 iron-containing alcohol dehydrogenase [Thermanaerothrix sp. 4228-RoL]
MMAFEFATAHRIRFGWGVFEESGRIASMLGNVAFLVRGKYHPDQDRLRDLLRENQVLFHEFIVDGEPTVDLVKQAVAQAIEGGCNCVIGFGGGSVIDTAKAVSAMLTNPGQLEDYLEVIGAGKTLEVPAAPCLAIPTTAGTGSEVTRNAVLGIPDVAIKVSLRSPLMLPAVALVDPALTRSVPPSITAYTGMDALTQVLEPYVSVRANVMTDMFCREGLQRVSKALPAAFKDGADQEARKTMAWVSLLGGLALANAGLGAVHGLAAPIGGMFKAPHGAICARLLPLVVRTNLKALRSRQPENPALERYREIAGWLTQRPDAQPEDGVAWLEQMVSQFGIPGLGTYGMTRQDIPVVVERSLRASSMKGNPIPLTSDELTAILEDAL